MILDMDIDIRIYLLIFGIGSIDNISIFTKHLIDKNIGFKIGIMLIISM